MSARQVASAIAAGLMLAAASGAQAASENECAAWLCVTVGFAPPACAPAKAAMLRRVFEGKNPLPGFGSCTADGNADGFDAILGHAARIGSSTPPVYQKGTRCTYDDENQSSDDWKPTGCTGTYRYVIALQDGQPIGDTFYWRDRTETETPRPSGLDDHD